MDTLIKTVLLGLLACSIAWLLNLLTCKRGESVTGGEDVSRVVIVDTVARVCPEAVAKGVVRLDTVRLSVASWGGWKAPAYRRPDFASRVSDERDETEASDDIRSDEGDGTEEDDDSARVVIPIEQRVYEDSMYRAWVSGYNASLDSLYIYPRREVVTVRRPQKRWHIGPTVGVGITPAGLQPYAGISVTYSIFAF